MSATTSEDPTLTHSEDEDGESEEFSADDEDYDELDYLDEADNGLMVLTDAEMEFLQDEAPATPTIEAPNLGGPTRATRGQRTAENTRTTFICLNQEAFRNQLQKEEQKSGNIELPSGPTRANRGSQTRATFICINQENFDKDLQSQAETPSPEKETQTSVSTTSPLNQPPSRPPRPERPARPPRSSVAASQDTISNNNQGKFGKAPPARKVTLSASATSPPSKQPIPPAFRELIQTEKDYIEKLEIIQNVFMAEIRKQKLLSTYETVSLFSNIEDLIPVNKKLLEDLCELEGQKFVSTKSVGEVFQSHAKNFRKYAVYCSNQPNIHELLIEYKKQNPEFTEFLKKCFRIPECKKQDIESFLMMPLQRLCRYPLLIKELVSYESYTLKKHGPAASAEHGICMWGGGSSEIHRIDMAQHWSGISCGGLHYAAVSLGNSIFVWGKGKEGQLGLGDDVTHRDEPTLVPLYSSSNQPLKSRHVCCGPLQTGVITEDNELYLWGALPDGLAFTPQLQLFEDKPRSIRSVAFGVTCMFAVVESEEDPTETEVWVWGKSSKGQLGLGEDVQRVQSPTKILELSSKNIIQISCGEAHTACLSEHGAVFIWGDNSNNELGLGSTPVIYRPQLVMPLLGKDIMQVECGFRHTFARSKDKIWAWGYGRHGVLGIGSSVDHAELTEVTTLENKQISQIVSGGMHAFAVSEAGKTYSWGEGRGYKTCTGSEEDTLTPTLVKELSGYVVKEVACGSRGSIAFYEKFSETQSSIVNLDMGLDEFKSVVVEINDQVRQVENITSLLKITNRIQNGQKLHLVSQNRHTVLEGPVNTNGKSRYGFLMNDILLLCRLPSRSDPEKLYKGFRRFAVEDICVAELPDSSTEGKNRFEIHVKKENQKEYYIVKFRKKDKKIAWWRAITGLGVPVVEPSPLEVRPVVTKARKASVLPKEDEELVEKAVEALLAQLQKELKEETEARTVAEQHNQVMKNLVYDQKKVETDNLMDDCSMMEFEARVESLSSLVDKLTAENISLSNQVKARKTELISLRKANGKSIDDLIAEVDVSESDDSE